MLDPSGRIGQKVGEYRIIRYLGQGNFGIVYLAEHIHDRALVAVKVLQLSFTKLDNLQDFLNEARVIRLKHPHIVSILDFGVGRDGFPFLVMTYAAGGTLRDRHAKGEKVPVALVDAYVQQLASALQYAHDRHIIHRDIKPENMLIDDSERVQLSDFGIAKTSEQQSLNSQLTVRGTPAYTAPEQSNGQPCPASDQYALAVVVYEWLTGRRPFSGNPLEVLFHHRTTLPTPLRAIVPGISTQVEQVVFKALAKAPEERFPSIAHFAQAFHLALQSTDISQLTTWRMEPASNTSSSSYLSFETKESFLTHPHEHASLPSRPPIHSAPSGIPFAQAGNTSSGFSTQISATQKATTKRASGKLWRNVLVASLCLLLVIGASSSIWLFLQQQAQQRAFSATATQQAQQQQVISVTATQQTRQQALAATATATVRAYSALSSFTTHSVIGLTAASVNGQAGVYLAWLNSQTSSDGLHHIDIASTPTGDPSDFSNRVELTDSSPFGPGICTFHGRLYVAFQGGEGRHYMHIGYFDGSSHLVNGTFMVDSSGANPTAWSRPTCAAYNGQLYVAWADAHPPHAIQMISSSDGQHFGAVTTFANTEVGCADPSFDCNSALALPTAPFIADAIFPGQAPRLYISWHSSTSNTIDLGYYDATNPSNMLQGLTLLSDSSTADPALLAYNNELWVGWGTVGSTLLQIASTTDGTALRDNRSNPCGFRGTFAAALATLNGHLYIADDIVAGAGTSTGIGYCRVE